MERMGMVIGGRRRTKAQRKEGLEARVLMMSLKHYDEVTSEPNMQATAPATQRSVWVASHPKPEFLSCQ
jgi:hypothetical protein